MLYVDDAKMPFRHMIMSHMMADTPEELRQAERDLGIPEGSVQHPGEPSEHLDVSQTKRTEDIRRLGAKEISSRDMVRIIQARRQRRAEKGEKKNEAPPEEHRTDSP